MEGKRNILGHIGALKWTKITLDCYKRGCNCKGCFYENFFSKSKYGAGIYNQKCQAKATVLELIKNKIGLPDERNKSK